MSAATREIAFYEPWFEAAYADRVHTQVASGWVGPGPTSSSFAARLAEFAGVPFCSLTTSGTVALSLAGHAVALAPGDEILVPAYGVISTINAFAAIGLRPRLVDIKRSTGAIDPAALSRAIGPQARAVCFVNFSGYTGPDLEEAVRICRERGVPLIEDAAAALGHRHAGRAAGSFGDVGIYSFSVPKIITTGQGGALVTASEAYFRRIQNFSDHGGGGWRQTNLVPEVGTNYRFNDILASFGLAQMEDLEPRLARKRAAYATLREHLGPFLYQVPGDEAPLHYVVLAADRERMLAALRERGIQAVWQYRTVSDHPPYAHLREGEHSFPEADFWTRHAVYLPFGLALTPEDAARIARAVQETGVELLPFGE